MSCDWLIFVLSLFDLNIWYGHLENNSKAGFVRRINQNASLSSFKQFIIPQVANTIVLLEINKNT